MDCGSLRWFGHVMGMGENEYMKRVYEGRLEEGNVSGRHHKVDQSGEQVLEPESWEGHD